VGHAEGKISQCRMSSTNSIYGRPGVYVGRMRLNRDGEIASGDFLRGGLRGSVA